MKNGTTVLADDLLDGIKAISEHVFGNADTKSVRRTYYLAERGHLPTFKLGNRWQARKSEIDRSLSAVGAAELGSEAA